MNWRNNIKCYFHRFYSIIDINFIKAWRYTCPEESDDLDQTGINQYSEELKTSKLNTPRTLELTDDLFAKDLTKDFIYYLSQEDHTITNIDATKISDSKMK